MVSQKIMLETVKIGLENHRHVVIEGIFPASNYNDFFKEINALAPNNCYFFYFDIPFDETLRRHNMKPNAADFGEEEMRDWWKEKDFLKSFREDVIDENYPEDTTIEHIINKVGGL